MGSERFDDGLLVVDLFRECPNVYVDRVKRAAKQLNWATRKYSLGIFTQGLG